MNTLKPRILTGHRPTGARHIGHLAGTLYNWVKMQESHDAIFLIADLHVMTTDYEHPDRIRANIFEVALDWLAVGVDPEKATLALQSAIPAHAELCLLLGMLVTDARLHRVPTFKDQVQNLNLEPSLGLLTYPVLQAADILLYHADAVPIGQDQLPHLELTRELARKFNNQYGEYFKEPEAILSSTPRLPGTDNRVMHTSYGNTILLKDSPAETSAKVMGMYTDPTRLRASDPGHVEGNPVFDYLDLFDPDAISLEELKTMYRAGKIGDVAVKQHLARVLNEALAPIRARREELAHQQAHILEILSEGTNQASAVASSTLAEVKERMGLSLSLDVQKHGNPRSPANPLLGAFC